MDLPQEGAAARTAAEIHFWLDLLIEAPLVLAVTITGFILLLGSGPISGMLWWKLALGAIPIVSCTLSIIFVFHRHRRLDDPAALSKGRKRVLMTALAVGPVSGEVGVEALEVALAVKERILSRR